jgi:hypothetical protein
MDAAAVLLGMHSTHRAWRQNLGLLSASHPQHVAAFAALSCRLEKDAVDWARILGGIKKYLAEYARSFAAAGFSKRKDLYIASGLLSYNASQEMKDMLTFLEPHSRCGHTWLHEYYVCVV